MRSMRSYTRGIVVYLAIAFGGAWGTWAVAWYFGALDTGLRGQLIVAAGAFAPALGALIVRAFVTREGFADAGLRLHLKQWPYYLCAWLLPLPVVTAIAGLAMGLGISPHVPTLPLSLLLSALGGTLISAPLFFGEEFGWRGYLQLRLLAHRPLLAAASTGLIWGVFHYPVILVGYEGYEHVLLGLAIFPVFTILLSIILGWLRLKTGSVWVTCLAHAAANGLGGSLTAYLFLHSGHFSLLSYAGILAWIPLGVICTLLFLTGQLRQGPTAQVKEGVADRRAGARARESAQAIQSVAP
jgi:membrane protease YdiL (CAAX protease family)